ncbi:unnamed protein product [Trichogramma brassicae]|uniref:Uncharacterized protein n=1 Tax=Trichogramma brassicae TaxID=86971 RepID=A0A6H5IT54_9HYME|nr:unnamed protein product [Trichogramma brassicae]
MLASREAYVETAIGYVEVRRESNLCTAKCRVARETIFSWAVIDEASQKIVKVECNYCAASADVLDDEVALCDDDEESDVGPSEEAELSHVVSLDEGQYEPHEAEQYRLKDMNRWYVTRKRRYSPTVSSEPKVHHRLVDRKQAIISQVKYHDHPFRHLFKKVFWETKKEKQ